MADASAARRAPSALPAPRALPTRVEAAIPTALKPMNRMLQGGAAGAGRVRRGEAVGRGERRVDVASRRVQQEQQQSAENVAHAPI